MSTGINMNHVCMKLIRTELIKDIRFDPTLKTAEDLKFCVELFCKVESYYFINRAFYHYCRNEESLTGRGLGGREKLKANRRVSSIQRRHSGGCKPCGRCCKCSSKRNPGFEPDRKLHSIQVNKHTLRRSQFGCAIFCTSLFHLNLL